MLTSPIEVELNNSTTASVAAPDGHVMGPAVMVEPETVVVRLVCVAGRVKPAALEMVLEVMVTELVDVTLAADKST